MTQYCFLTAGSWHRNASTVRLRELGAALAERGLAISYVVDDLPEHHGGELHLDRRAHVTYVSPCQGPGQFIARRQALRRLSPEVIHVLNPMPKLFLALAGKRTRLVGDWDEWPSRRRQRPPRHALDLYIDRWLRKRADLTVVASRYLKARFRELYGLDALYVPYAVSSGTHADGRSPYVEPTAVYLGNFFPAYDHDLLFEAALLLTNRGACPRIDFLGAGPDVERWRSFVVSNGLDNVRLLGYVEAEELWRRLRHAHVLLLPLRPTVLNRARCPSKIFAYLKARRPVIANRVGEVACVLGDTPWYVEPTPEAFADAIEQAAASAPLAEVGHNLTAHSWTRRAEILLAGLVSAGVELPREAQLEEVAG